MSKRSRISRYSEIQTLGANKDFLTQILLSLVAGIILINGFLFSYVWVTQEYLGRDTSNAVLGTNYDPVNFGIPVVTNQAKSFGKDLESECPVYTRAGISCPHHWFGDFYANFNVVQTRNAWNYGENPNFPASNILTKLLTIFPYIFALTLYLVLLSLAMCFPIWYATKSLPFNMRLLFTAVLGLFSYPALFTLDRANTQGFVPLFLFAFALLNTIGSNSSTLLKNASALLFAWKIHTWPLILLSKGNKFKENRRVFVRAMFISVICLIPWFGLINSAAAGLLGTYLGMTSTNTDLNIGIWRNQSLSGLIYTLSKTVFDINLLLNWRISITTGVVYIGLMVFLVARRDYPLWIKLFLLSSIMQMSVPRGYGYGSSYLIAVIAVLAYESLSKNTSQSDKALEIFRNRFRKMFIVCSFCLMLSVDFAITPSNPDNIITGKNFIQPICVIILVGCFFSAYKKSDRNSPLKSS